MCLQKKSVAWSRTTKVDCDWLQIVLLTDIDKAAVVLQALLCAALGDLGFFLRGNLGGLTTHLTGTGERAVDLACITKEVNSDLGQKAAWHTLLVHICYKYYFRCSLLNGHCQLRKRPSI